MSTEGAIAVARLIAELEPVDGRKRLQKIVHLLDASGVSEFRHRFILHYFGPFSRELASELDFLVAAQLVAQVEPGPEGGSYRYSIPSEAIDSLNGFYQEEFGTPNWIERAKELKRETTPQLEAMSTLVFLAQRGFADNRLQAEFERVKPNLISEFRRAKQRAEELRLLNVK